MELGVVLSLNCVSVEAPSEIFELISKPKKYFAVYCVLTVASVPGNGRRVESLESLSSSI